MENKIDDICRICLKVEGTDFLPLDEYRITKLKVVIPQLNINGNGSGRFMMCVKCKDALDEAYTLRRMILDNQELILSRKSKLGIQTKVNLDRIFTENESDWNQNTICRICLNLSKEKNVFIDSLPPDDPFQDVLHMCLSILDRELIANPLICVKCVDKLLEMFTFISSALDMENKIRQYCESNPETKDLLQNHNLDLNQVLTMLKDREEDKSKDEEPTNDFLSEFEVKDEEENDIFDSIPDSTPASYAEQQPQTANNLMVPQQKSENDTTKKRPAESPIETAPPKKSKHKMHLTEELTPFRFSSNLLYNHNEAVGLAEWLSIVDLQKSKFKWSDNVTIQKVLLKLQYMPELCSWFSSMADILSWKEWKKKLVAAFPDQDDYCMCLRKALARKRKPTETFLEYLNAKVELLKNVNITGPNAISCIINGVPISDGLVCCLSRIGKYKSIEELSEYFKKCDEKEAVSDKADKNQVKSEVAVTPHRNNDTKVSKTLTPTKPVGAKSQSFVDVKKGRGKCFNCLKHGHVAAECTAPVASKPPAPKPQVHGAKPKTLPTGKGNKPPPVLCTYCGKFGHNIRDCFFAKMAQTANNQNHHPQNPNAVPTPKQLKSMKAVVKCGYCSKPGHSSDVCRFANKKAVKNALKEAMDSIKGIPPKVNTNATETECQLCGSSKHYTRHCGKRPSREESLEWRVEPERNSRWDTEPVRQPERQPERFKKSVRHRDRREGSERYSGRHEEPDRYSEEREEPERYLEGHGEPERYLEGRESCYHCGSQSHLPTACYYSYKPPSSDSRRKKSDDPLFEQLMCFGCYKVGHETKDCPKNRGMSYRS